MQIIRQHAYARAGLIGNPSDGYFGKTISLALPNFQAQVVLYEWEDLELIPSPDDQSRFGSTGELVLDVKLHGYYGGLRLIKATIKKFVEYCQRQEKSLHGRNFSIRYQTNIPRQVGLAGSSAIIVATLRALTEFYEIDIPQRVLPSLALSVEKEELGIAGGLQDRVIQVYEGLVYMDFHQDRACRLEGFDCGHYEQLEVELPNLYVAYADQVSEPTEVVHNDLLARWERREPAVLAAMNKLADLAAEGRQALLAGDHARFGELMDENFNTRRSILKIASGQLQMVERARATGASAKFAGSGGAIVGTYRDEAMYQALVRELADIPCQVFKPTRAAGRTI